MVLYPPTFPPRRIHSGPTFCLPEMTFGYIALSSPLNVESLFFFTVIGSRSDDWEMNYGRVFWFGIWLQGHAPNLEAS